MRFAKLRYLLPIGALVGLLIGLATNSMMAQSPGINSPWNVVWNVPVDSIKRTYSQSLQLSPGVVATDISTLCGSGTPIQTKLTRIIVSGRTSAVSPMDLFLVKRSNWDITASTAPSVTGIPYDANDAASVAAVTWYQNAGNQGNSPVLGTLVGVIGAAQIYLGNLTTGTPGQPMAIFDYGNRPDKAPTLRSATQCLAINISGTGAAGNLLDITWEWTEEP